MMLSYLLDDFVHSGSPPIDRVMVDICRISQSCAKILGLDSNLVRANVLGLYKVLIRYTRDAFGCQRVVKFIDDRFNSVSDGMPDNKKKI